MENFNRYAMGAIIGIMLGMMLTMWISIKLTDVRPLPAHRVSVDNDRHVYWCTEYKGAE